MRIFELSLILDDGGTSDMLKDLGTGFRERQCWSKIRENLGEAHYVRTMIWMRVKQNVQLWCENMQLGLWDRQTVRGV